jgi:hypothetical protein
MKNGTSVRPISQAILVAQKENSVRSRPISQTLLCSQSTPDCTRPASCSTHKSATVQRLRTPPASAPETGEENMRGGTCIYHGRSLRDHPNKLVSGRRCRPVQWHLDPASTDEFSRGARLTDLVPPCPARHRRRLHRHRENQPV